MQPLTYAYECQVYHWTKKTTFSQALSRHLLGQRTVASPSGLPDDAVNATIPNVLRQKILEQVAAMQEKSFEHFKEVASHV